MKTRFQQTPAEGSAVELPTDNQALAVIREQFQRLDPDEQRIFRRILRQAERLDAALADLHLFLPMIEICFYGVPSGDDTGHRLSAKGLRKLIRRWGVANRNNHPQVPAGGAGVSALSARGEIVETVCVAFSLPLSGGHDVDYGQEQQDEQNRGEEPLANSSAREQASSPSEE